MMKNVISLVLLLFFVPYIAGCQSSSQEGVKVMPMDVASDLETLAGARVFFGHQSVGKNIIHGLEKLSNDIEDVNLTIADYESYQADGSGCFLHTRVGKNREPESKCLDFGRIIDQELNDKIDYALLKFCYVDINKDSNVAKVFDDYRRVMDDLIERHPDIIFVHTTMPLMQNRGGIKIKIKELLGDVHANKLDNIKRNEFNSLLKETYSNAPIIDIAESESTYPDGSREEFKMDGKTYYSLIEGYTNDGGHLNDQGQIKVASTFVQGMADIIRNRPSAIE
ncbi:MAG: hypothetical protein AB2598_15255 [Candidatus Thiodiazotropha sp.]